MNLRWYVLNTEISLNASGYDSTELKNHMMERVTHMVVLEADGVIQKRTDTLIRRNLHHEGLFYTSIGGNT